MLIHCTMEELIAVRDGEGTQGALRHLDDCQECRDELDRLHQRIAALRALPAVTPPRDRWSAIADRLHAERRRQRRRLAGWVSVAAAASLAVAAGIGQLVPSLIAARAPVDPLATLVEESQDLEVLLRSIEADAGIMNGRVATAVAVIEDRLAEVDLRLSASRQRRVPRELVIDLWRQRVDLMDALVRVRVTKSTYMGF